MARKVRKVIAQEDGRIGMQGMGGGRSVLRSRLPAGIIEALEAEDGNYVHWTLYDDGMLVGYLIDESEAKPRDMIAEKRASTKKKGGAKKAANKGKRRPKAVGKGNGLDAAFGSADEDDEDDGSLPSPKRTSRRPTPVGGGKKAAASKRPLPASSGRVPRRQGPIPKPGRTKSRGKGGVRYTDLPE